MLSPSFRLKTILFLLFSFCLYPCLAQKTWNIKDFGANPINRTTTSKALQRALDSSSLKGGIAFVPPGVFPISSLRLPSKCTLFLSAGSVLQGPESPSDYPQHASSIKFGKNGQPIQTLLWADSAESITITGPGIIDGRGDAEAFHAGDMQKKVRPMVLRFINSKNIRIEKITLRQSPWWMQQYIGCEGVWIDGITVFNHAGKNNDGLDIAGCKNVFITNCVIDADDDGICFKSHSIYPNENIHVSHCTIASNCNALKIGTETRADNKNFLIDHLILKRSEVKSDTWGRQGGLSGIAIESVDGSKVEDIQIDNVQIEGYYAPLFIRLGNRGTTFSDQDPKPEVGKINNVNISNVYGTADRIPENIISGIPNHHITNLTFKNIELVMQGIPKVAVTIPTSLPEMENAYPEIKTFGPITPAGAIFIRHVRDLSIENFKVTYLNTETRPSLVFVDVENIQLFRHTYTLSYPTEALFQFKGCKKIKLDYPIFNGLESVKLVQIDKADKTEFEFIYKNKYWKKRLFKFNP